MMSPAGLRVTPRLRNSAMVASSTATRSKALAVLRSAVARAGLGLLGPSSGNGQHGLQFADPPGELSARSQALTLGEAGPARTSSRATVLALGG